MSRVGCVLVVLQSERTLGCLRVQPSIDTDSKPTAKTGRVLNGLAYGPTLHVVE